MSWNDTAMLRACVKIDGTALRAVPAPAELPGSRVVQIFQIGGGAGNVVTLLLPGMPANPRPLFPSIFEVFLLDGKNLLQLTRFDRVDTAGELLSVDRRRVFFRASADPFGTNPSENCQLFSVDTFGRHLRQITHFGASTGEQSAWGCTLGPPPGCHMSVFTQDPVTRTLVFYSSCDPLGRNPNGAQIFAMRPGR